MTKVKTANTIEEKDSEVAKLEIYHENWDNMDIPNNVIFEENKNFSHTGRFILEPLYKGYGQTIGNSLRRVLLSSLIGAAVSAVKIEGVEHEYQSIKSIREDVLQIILNLKELCIKPIAKGPYEAKISVKGPKIVTAKDIETGSKFEIINPEQIICHIEQNITFEITLFIKIARGYVSSEENFQQDLPISTIFLDSNHSPVMGAKFAVENTRVRQKTDYEKLIFDLETNGAISPKDAVGYACKILKDYFTSFITFDVNLIKPKQLKINKESDLNPHLLKSINELELSIRSINCLQNAKIETIGQLVKKTEAEMLKTKNFGKKSLLEIKNILASMGLTLGMNINIPTVKKAIE